LKLSIEDRILTYGLTPPKGDYELLKAFKQLENQIKFTEEETRNYDIKQEVDAKTGLSQVRFNKEVADVEDSEIEVKIPPRALSFIVERLEKASNEGELIYQQMGIYEKFVLGVKPKEVQVKESKNVRNISSKGKGINK
jgi:HSP20 family molecular chaperone IbpA